MGNVQRMKRTYLLLHTVQLFEGNKSAARNMALVTLVRTSRMSKRCRSEYAPNVIKILKTYRHRLIGGARLCLTVAAFALRVTS